MGDKRRSIAQLAKEGLKKNLNVRDLFAVGYGDLGSSIYYALGITAFYALGATPIALLLAGLVFACTSITYAEMSAALKEGGGSAAFARVAFNDLISFIAGWGLLLDFIVTIAISIFSIAPYLAFLHPAFKDPWIHLGFSSVLIIVLFFLNLSGVKHSTRISLYLTSIALITQFFVVFLGFFALDNYGQVIEHLKVNVGGATWSPDWASFAKGVAMAMVAYTGIESIAQLGAETRRPIKTLPRAVMLTMGVLVSMYIGVSLVGMASAGPFELGTTYSQDPLAGIVENLPFGSKVLGPWIGLLAALLLFVAGNAGLLGASRLSYNLSENYQLPRFFSRTHKKFRTPYFSLGFFAFAAIVIILWSRGKLHFLADLYNFGAMLAFFSAHVSLIALRIKQPELERPFKSPLNISFGKFSLPLTAIIGGLSTFSVWILVIITKPEGRYLGFAWMILGIGMYLAYRKKKRIAPTGQLAIEKVKVPEFKVMEVTHILVPTRGGEETETVQIACEIAKQHKAKLTAVNFIPVLPSLPLRAPLPYREQIAEAILQRAEAIGGEFGVDIDTAFLRCREVDEMILALLKAGEYDMLVLGSSRENEHSGLGRIAENVLKNAPCRVVICHH